MSEKEISELQTELAVLRAEFEAYKQRTTLHLDLLEKAKKAQDEAMTIRLDKMNEIRDAMADQAARFIYRDIFEAKICNVEDKIYGQQKFIWMMAGACVIIPLAISVILKVI